MARDFSFKGNKPSAFNIVKESEKIAFSFAELRSFSYIDNKHDSKFFMSFLDRLKKLSSVDWNTINTSARHSFGLEKIDTKCLTSAARNHVPEGMDSLLVFRATGNNHAFLGYRDGNTFQIVFIEYNFCDVYEH